MNAWIYTDIIRNEEAKERNSEGEAGPLYRKQENTHACNQESCWYTLL